MSVLSFLERILPHELLPFDQKPSSVECFKGCGETKGRERWFDKRP